MVIPFWQIKNIILSLLSKRTVGARCLLIKDGQVLLVKHTYTPKWYTVGGGVEPGESTLQAVLRELKEEVGATPNLPPEIFGVYHSTNEGRDDYIIMYVCEDFILTPVTSPEIAEISWFSFHALPEDISVATKRRIDEYLGTVPRSDKW